MMGCWLVGTSRVDPFPHLEKYNAHTVFPNISIGQNCVPVNRVELLNGYETPNPYRPEGTMNFASGIGGLKIV